MISAESRWPPAFTFGELHARTSGLPGPERMAVFFALPGALQREAWDELAEAMAHRAALDFRDWCGDGC